MRARLFAIATVLMLAAIAFNDHAAEGSVIYSGSGVGANNAAISASVTFDFVRHDFGLGSVDSVQISVSNTSPTTAYSANLISGLFFSVDGDVGSLSTTSAGFDGLAATLRTSNTKSVSNVDIAPAVRRTPTYGAYVLSNGPFRTANDGTDFSSFAYGIATAGMGLVNGSAVDGVGYGIAAAGSNLNSDGLKTLDAVVDATAVFWIAAPSAWTSLDQIADPIRVTFGSAPEAYLTLTRPHIAPEPASMLVWGGVFAFALVGPSVRRRRRAA